MLNKETAKVLVKDGLTSSIMLDATSLDFEEQHNAIREHVKRNQIEFHFPAGVNKIDIFEECRALTELDDFETMFDVTMQLLEDKDMIISLTDAAGNRHEACAIHITNIYQDLRANPFIDEFPVVITWLCEFMSGLLRKKYPVPGKLQNALTLAQEEQKKEREKDTESK